MVATGGGGQNGLDILGFSNIANPKSRYYAPVFVGWLFLGTLTPFSRPLTIAFILWYLTRELFLFKRTRQEYLRRPEIASNIASRTILLTAIPQDMLTEPKLKEIFGAQVEKIWINRDHKELQDLVDDRNEAALVLEGAETSLIKDVNKIAIKKGRKEKPEGYDKNISTLYLKDKKRPHHKLGLPVIKLLFGKKVALFSGSMINDRSTQLNGHA
jgi:calcium permeable stress-gated cation channel